MASAVLAFVQSTATADTLTTAEQSQQQAIVNARVINWQNRFPSVAGMPMTVIVLRKNGGDLRLYSFGCKKWCSGSSCQPGSCLNNTWSLYDMFELGSLTKTFTATLAAEMSEAAVTYTSASGVVHTFTLDKRVTDFWNHRTFERAETTIWELMSHWSGLARNLPPQDLGRVAIMNRAFMPNATSGSSDSGNTTCWGTGLGDTTPEDCEDPLTSWHYSSFAFHLLGNILGDIHHHIVNNNTTSQSYWLDALNSRILYHLGAVGYEQLSSFQYPAGPLPDNIVHAYLTTGGSNPTYYDSETYLNGINNASPPGFSAAHAGAGLWISVYDLASWMRYSMAQWSALPYALNASMKAAIEGNLYNTCYDTSADGQPDTKFNATIGGSVTASTGAGQHRMGNAWNWDYDKYKRNGTPIVTMTKNGSVSAWRSNVRLTPPSFPAYSNCVGTPNVPTAAGGAAGLGVAIVFGGMSQTETNADDLASNLSDLIYADLLTVASP